jgi:hypothetical protein
LYDKLEQISDETAFPYSMRNCKWVTFKPYPQVELTEITGGEGNPIITLSRKY